MNDTQPSSSRSLAGGFTEPAFERECYKADEAAAEKEFDDRALAAAEALTDKFMMRDWMFDAPHLAENSEIAAILRPFLQSKPKP